MIPGSDPPFRGPLPPQPPVLPRPVPSTPFPRPRPIIRGVGGIGGIGGVVGIVGVKGVTDQVDNIFSANCQLAAQNAIGGLLDTQHGAGVLSGYAGQAAQTARDASHGQGMPPGCASTLAQLADLLQQIADMAGALEQAAAAIRAQLGKVDCSDLSNGPGAVNQLANEAARLAARLAELVNQYNALAAQVQALLDRCVRHWRGGTPQNV